MPCYAVYEINQTVLNALILPLSIVPCLLVLTEKVMSMYFLNRLLKQCCCQDTSQTEGDIGSNSMVSW